MHSIRTTTFVTTPIRPRRFAIAFLPIVTLWLVLALASRSAHDIVAPTVVLVMTIALLSFGRRRLNHAQTRAVTRGYLS